MQQQQQEQQQHLKPYRILLGFTGSVATIKCQELIESIKSVFEQHAKTVEIQVVVTQRALKFMKDLPCEVHTDEAEWNGWQQRGDPVMHIQLRQWADIMAICPLSANTLAKISNGLCDNLLTCIVRAWDFKRNNENQLIKPIIVAPAMNTMMYEHPITEKQLGVLRELGFGVVDPVEKVLMCNDRGIGAMAETLIIAQFIYDACCR